MKLNGDFFVIERNLPQTEGVIYGFDVKLNPEHYIYKAHFPGHPITPGVCLLQMVAELASEAEKCALGVLAVKNAKYTGVVDPSENSLLSFIFTSRSELEDGSLKVQVQVTDPNNPDTIFSKFSVTLTKEKI